MSSITNLLRDIMHVNPAETSQGFPADYTKGKIVLGNSNGIVNDTYAQASTLNYFNAATRAYDRWAASGILISQPVVDSTPYRVKANVKATATVYIVCGYAPQAPTGNSDIIEEVTAWPLENGYSKFDEVLLLPGKNLPMADRPIFIGVAIGGADANHVAEFCMSVQNLAKTSPQFAASMS